MIAGGLWAYFAEHPEASAIFNATMETKAQVQIATLSKGLKMTAADFFVI